MARDQSDPTPIESRDELVAWLEAGEKGDGPFLMGAVMTVADILAAHCLIWGIGAKFPAPEGALADYLARMRARPAFARAMAR